MNDPKQADVWEAPSALRIVEIVDGGTYVVKPHQPEGGEAREPARCEPEADG